MRAESGDYEYYTLEIVSQRLNLAPRAVRRYTRLGLVAPSITQGRRMFFSEADVSRLRKIVRLTRDLGLNMAGIEIVLRLTDEMEALRQELASQREDTGRS